MLGVRLDPETEAGLARLAKQTRRAKSDIAREAVRRYVARHDAAYLAEARRQSLLAAAEEDDDTLALLDELAGRLGARD